MMEKVRGNDERVLPYKEYKALFQATFPSAPVWKKKRLVSLFWLKQISLLALARRGRFIHEKEEWEAWLPTCTVNSSD